MAQFGIDPSVYGKPPFMLLSAGAFGLWVRMISYGATWRSLVVPRGCIRMMDGYPKHLRELEQAGLITTTDDRDWRLIQRSEWSLAARSRSRRAIPPSLRRRIFERDGHACRECGATERLSLDHVIPYSAGGSDDPENLQTLCVGCNSRKGAA